jgi:hypothetical protein
MYGEMGFTLHTAPGGIAKWRAVKGKHLSLLRGDN